MDAACYGALCKLTQPYLMRYPLIEGDGNFGTQEGNGMEASARYTNCRPSIYADLMMSDFKKNIVPLKETYNGEYMEPVVLPSLIPNAIVNGREAIAVGLSHCSLPHNMTEVCNAIVASLEKNRKLTVDEVMEYIKGPDFPLENVVINSADIRTAFSTGHSTTSLKVRGKYRIEKNKIIFDTIPYRTYRNKVKEQINRNIEIFEKLLDDFSDESNVGVNKLVFKVKKGINPEEVVNELFLLTDLQTTLSYNMNYIVNGTPKLCSMMDLIEAYINHQIKIIIKIAEFDKEKAEKRKHILEGLLLIISNIDEAIKIIKNSLNPKEAAEKLIQRFSLSENQAKAVLDMKLSKLTKLDKDDLFKELEQQKQIIIECNKIINDEVYRNTLLIKKVIALKNKYGDKRRTELLNIEIPKRKKEPKEKIEKIILPEEVVVVTTQSGLIKRIPPSSYRRQKKGGLGTKNTDLIFSILETNTTDYMMFFTNLGKMYKIPVIDIPEGTLKTKGIYIKELLNLKTEEEVVSITTLHSNSMPKFIVFITKNGKIKKSLLEDYSTNKKNNGITALKLAPEDNVKSILFQDEEDVLILTKNGKGIRFNINDITTQGRIAMGVKAINLDAEDEVIAGFALYKDTEYLGIVSSIGLGKKIKLTTLPCQKRGGKGSIVTKSDIAGVALFSDEDNIVIIGDKSTICISAKEIPSIESRTSAGNILIKNNVVQSITRIK